MDDVGLEEDLQVPDDLLEGTARLDLLQVDLA